MQFAIPDRYQPNISWGKSIACAVLFLVITAFVVDVLFLDYVFDPGVGLKGVSLDPIVYLLLPAFVAYKVQVWLSQAYGGRRVLETLLSIVMLCVIGLAVAIWINLLFVQPLLTMILRWIHHPIVSTPTPYKLAVVVIFGALALWDVLGRDILGIGRRSNMRFSGYRREDFVTGAHGDLPDATHVLESRSGEPVHQVINDVVVEFRYWARDPFTGELLQIQNPPPRIAARVIDHVGLNAPPVEQQGPPAPAGGPVS